jgi:hypothetical protein
VILLYPLYLGCKSTVVSGASTATLAIGAVVRRPVRLLLLCDV